MSSFFTFHVKKVMKNEHNITDITVRQCNYNCNSFNVIYLIKYKKCDSGNYIGDTSTITSLLMNSHKKCIRDNNKGVPVARNFNKPDHSISDLGSLILKRDVSNSTDRLIEEQTLIRKLKNDTLGLNQDLDFLTLYFYTILYYAFTSDTPLPPLTLP